MIINILNKLIKKNHSKISYKPKRYHQLVRISKVWFYITTSWIHHFINKVNSIKPSLFDQRRVPGHYMSRKEFEDAIGASQNLEKTCGPVKFLKWRVEHVLVGFYINRQFSDEIRNLLSIMKFIENLTPRSKYFLNRADLGTRG